VSGPFLHLGLTTTVQCFALKKERRRASKIKPQTDRCGTDGGALGDRERPGLTFKEGEPLSLGPALKP